MKCSELDEKCLCAERNPETSDFDFGSGHVQSEHSEDRGLGANCGFAREEKEPFEETIYKYLITCNFVSSHNEYLKKVTSS